MRKIFTVLLAILVLHASAEAADKIRIAYPGPATQFIPLQLAQKKGFLKEEGLEAEIIQMRGPVAMVALVTGEIGYYTVGSLGVGAAIRGLPDKVVACYVPGAPIALIARPEFKSVQELKGKTIMVGVAGTTPDLIARMIVKHFGLDPEKDVKFLPGGSSDARLAALKQGLVAGTVVTPPFDFHAKKLDLNILARAHELFSYPEAGLVATTKKIKEKPDEVKRVIKAGIKANRYIRANREGTIQFLMDWQKSDKEIATATYEYLATAINDDGSLPEKGFRLLIEENKELAKVVREVALSDVADLTILREAQMELGIMGR